MKQDAVIVGQDELAVERFMDDTRHMIIFDVLDDHSPIGSAGERIRLFLTDKAYSRALAAQKCGYIRIKKHAAIIEGHILPDRKKNGGTDNQKLRRKTIMDLKKANYLKASLTGLFRSGADDDHTPDEMEELLDGIDFSALLQAFHSLWQHVYEYQIESGSAKGFEYRGLELLPRNAVLLYTDEGCSFFDVATHERAYELWMLPDASFVVLSLVRTVVGDDEIVMEYRSIKAGNWRETEMDIDFLDLSDDLEELCDAVRAQDLPLYEL